MANLNSDRNDPGDLATWRSLVTLTKPSLWGSGTWSGLVTSLPLFSNPLPPEVPSCPVVVVSPPPPSLHPGQNPGRYPERSVSLAPYPYSFQHSTCQLSPLLLCLFCSSLTPGRTTLPGLSSVPHWPLDSSLLSPSLSSKIA